LTDTQSPQTLCSSTLYCVQLT